MVRPDDLPCPPLDLVNRVLNVDDFGGDPLNAYEFFGRSTRENLVEILPNGYSFGGRRILDFGCGAGRTLRHFREEAATAEFWGADLDRASIGWLQENLCPPFHTVLSDVDPPLPFESASFDLAYAISVFTHLASNSFEWLLELHRILKPDGLLMASYMGEFNCEEVAGEAWDEDRIGMNVIRHNQSWDLGGPMVLMSDWWVKEHWGRAFEIVDVRPGIHGQTWTLLKKRKVTLTASDLAEPSDDPREFAALRHNLAQLQQEIEEQPENAAKIRTAFLNSLSWRITKPLRSVRSLAGKRSR